jgi:hypothetical protein
MVLNLLDTGASGHGRPYRTLTVSLSEQQDTRYQDSHVDERRR